MIWGLLDFDPRSKESVEQWALWHSSDHDEIRGAVLTALATNLTAWLIYPFDLKHWDDWALRHQALHNEMNQASSLAGTDLAKVNFLDSGARSSWHLQHFREHLAQRNKYGI